MSKIFNRSFSIPKDIIKEAIDNTDSMAQAAHYLGISYPTFKKYARVYKV